MARVCPLLRVVGCLVLVIGVSQSASAQNLKIPATLFVTSAALDVTTTHHILANGGTERNPLLAVWGTPNRITAAMIGGDALAALLTWKLKARHPKLAAVVLYSVGSVHLACGIGNLRHLDPPARQAVPGLVRRF